MGDETGTFWGREERKRKMEKDRMEGRPEELRGSRKCKLEEWVFHCLQLLSFLSREPTPIKGLLTKFSPKNLWKQLQGLHVANLAWVKKHWNAQGSLLESLSSCLCSLFWWSHPALLFYSLLIHHDPQALFCSSELYTHILLQQECSGWVLTLRWGIRIHWWWW